MIVLFSRSFSLLDFMSSPTCHHLLYIFPPEWAVFDSVLLTTSQKLHQSTVWLFSRVVVFYSYSVILHSCVVIHSPFLLARCKGITSFIYVHISPSLMFDLAWPVLATVLATFFFFFFCHVQWVSAALIPRFPMGAAHGVTVLIISRIFKPSSLTPGGQWITTTLMQIPSRKSIFCSWSHTRFPDTFSASPGARWVHTAVRGWIWTSPLEQHIL